MRVLRKRSGRRWLTAAAAMLCALAIPAIATAGQSFTFLQPGFTQAIFGVSSNFMGGVAFAPDADPWVDQCPFDGSPLTRFDGATTFVVNGTTLHPGTVFDSSAGCGLANGTNGNLYTNTSSGVRELDPNTGVPIGGPFGPAGNALGIAPDPVTGDLVYVGSNGTLLKVNEALTVSSTFSTVTTGNMVDGVAWSPDGNFVFLANRSPSLRLTILDRNGNLVQQVPMSNEPDGIAFHASTPKFVVTNNTSGNMTRFDFPADDYTQVPVQTLFASGGFRGDLSQVGADSCLYLTQDGTRYDDGTVTAEDSLVQICGGFAPPVPTADLSITKTGPATAQSGGTITYTLNVANAGPFDAHHVTVDDPLPAGETFVSASTTQGSCNGTVSCQLGTVANGGSVTITVVVQVTASCGSTITNTATVTGDEPDPDTSNNSDSSSTFVFCVVATGGNFVIGDNNAAIGTMVTFWGAQWSMLNGLSGGGAPPSFKGFEKDPPTVTCGTDWTSRPGNSSHPPAGPLPEFMAVIVSSLITKHGSTINGNTVHVVVVRTNPGYAPDPGHPGTGTVVAQIC
ncbi:MAG TPA: hypothetical protein VKB73_16240 [Gaiellaceae bacterium]|nr:hypothetical protein [Gaiellaceae bacterium]